MRKGKAVIKDLTFSKKTRISVFRFALWLYEFKFHMFKFHMF